MPRVKFLVQVSFLFLLVFLIIAPLGCGDDDDDDDNDAGGSDGDDDDDNDDNDNDDDNDDDDNDDDDDTFPPMPLLPGPGEDGYNADLEALARMYDRSFHVFTTAGMDLNCDIVVPVENTEDRALMDGFIRETDGWDFEAYSGNEVFDVVSSYQKVAGLYAGVGLAADAYRYGILRDQGYPQAEVDLARENLTAGLEALHIAHAITGVPGVIARGFSRLDIPGDAGSIALIPLFDEYGNPMPEEKTNGTWRADNSGGDYPNYIWEDSCSRDQFIGWTTAFAAAWEVIRDDPAFSEDIKDRMQEEARLIGLSLSVVRESGYDLEIFDADGRTAYHGYMNENNYDRIYIPFLPIKDGMYALMAVGCVAALAYVAEDAELDSYLYDELIEERKLHQIFRNNQAGVDLWIQSNYSSYNMAFQAAFLAGRYTDDARVQEAVAWCLMDNLYDHTSWHLRQPKELKQSLFDFVYAQGVAQANIFGPMSAEPDWEAVSRGVETLMEFPEPPFWEMEVINCDEDEILAKVCELNDGTVVDVLGYVGRNDDLISKQPIPMRTRPHSNYFWRSNPYCVNGGGNGGRMVPGVDFRWAYWLGRWVK